MARIKKPRLPLYPPTRPVNQVPQGQEISNVSTETRAILNDAYPPWHPVYKSQDVEMYKAFQSREPIYTEPIFDPLSLTAAPQYNYLYEILKNTLQNIDLTIPMQVGIFYHFSIFEKYFLQ